MSHLSVSRVREAQHVSPRSHRSLETDLGRMDNESMSSAPNRNRLESWKSAMRHNLEGEKQKGEKRSGTGTAEESQPSSYFVLESYTADASNTPGLEIESVFMATSPASPLNPTAESGEKSSSTTRESAGSDPHEKVSQEDTDTSPSAAPPKSLKETIDRVAAPEGPLHRAGDVARTSFHKGAGYIEDVLHRRGWIKGDRSRARTVAQSLMASLGAGVISILAMMAFSVSMLFSVLFIGAVLVVFLSKELAKLFRCALNSARKSHAFRRMVAWFRSTAHNLRTRFRIDTSDTASKVPESSPMTETSEIRWSMFAEPDTKKSRPAAEPKSELGSRAHLEGEPKAHAKSYAASAASRDTPSSAPAVAVDTPTDSDRESTTRRTQSASQMPEIGAHTEQQEQNAELERTEHTTAGSSRRRRRNRHTELPSTARGTAAEGQLKSKTKSGARANRASREGIHHDVDRSVPMVSTSSESTVASSTQHRKHSGVHEQEGEPPIIPRA